MKRRIIAIQMLPKAYDEIQKLKAEETWTRFIIQCVLAKVGDNSILQDELASLVKEPKEQKPKAEKKAKKVKTEVAVDTEVPSAEEAERVELEGGKVLIMPHTHKPKKGKKAAKTKVTGEEPTKAELKAIEEAGQ